MKQTAYLLILSATVLISACSNSQKNGTTDNKTTISFSKSEYKKQSVVSGKGNTELTAVIPIAEGDNQVAKNINDSVFRTIKLIVGQEGDKSMDYEELFSGFIKNYDKFAAETPDYNLPWEADIKGTVDYSNSDIINIKLVSYTMTGGAHGNPFTTSLLFSPKDGKELSIKDIVKDTASFTQLAEKKFRDKFNIPADKSINSTGLMFSNDKFALPQSIFVTKDGLLLYYNVYEIAAYVDGTKELLIPYNEIKDNLSVNIP